MAEANSNAAKDADGSEQPNDAKQRRKTFAEKRKEPLRAEIGRLSSLGDVATIRRRLQDRRSEVNKQIGVERKISDGSIRLARQSTLDSKTRDMAKLEHTFSQSKIQALQAELTKINSSLQAYQPKSVRDKQVPLVPFAMKTTDKVSFTSTFSTIIKKHYHFEPTDIQEAIYEFQEMRYSITSPTKDDAGIEMLFEYVNHLALVTKRFLNHKLAAGISYVWYDAISGLPAVQQSTVFEKACVVFNIAALYTQIGAQQDRSSTEGSLRALRYLEKSLGVFEYMRSNFTRAPTMDMSSEMLALFSDFVRAQAVEMQWERMVAEGLDEDKLSNLIQYAQKTKSVCECYKPIRDIVEDDNVKEYLPACWCTLVKVKDAQYKSLAHFYAAQVHRKLASICESGDSLPPDVWTDLHFLYTSETNSDELFSKETTHHIGLVKSHLNCASLLHEYALRYVSLCKELQPIVALSKMLEEASARTEADKAAVVDMESVAMIAPSINPCEVELSVEMPSFSSVKVNDLFRPLGPLSVFRADNSWSRPQVFALSKQRGGFGFSIKGYCPVKVASVEIDKSAHQQGIKAGDWVVSVNGTDVRYSSHDEVVSLVKGSGDELELEVVSPDHPDKSTSS